MPMDALPPLGKGVVLTHYLDANLMPHVLLGKVVTGYFHLFGQQNSYHVVFKETSNVQNRHILFQVHCL